MGIFFGKKRQKPDPHFSRWGPDYDIDIGFGGIDSKYATASIPEGIELLKGDIVDLAKKYWRSTKKKENQVGKLPPLPVSWAQGILRLLINPARGTLYEAVKKSPLKVSDFTTLVGGKSRRDLLLNLIGKKKKWSKDQLDYLRKLDDAKLDMGTQLEKYFAKFMKSLDDGTPMPSLSKTVKLNMKTPKVEIKRLDLLKKLKKLKNKAESAEKKLKSESELLKAKMDKTTFHAEGGIAGMLGEPRSGYQGGGDVGYQKYWKMVTEMFIQLGGEKELKMTLHQFADKEFPRPGRAEGGRIGLAEGDTPSQAWMRDYFYSSGYDDIGVITLDEYINGPIGWKDYMEHGPGKAKGGRIGYDNGGSTEQEDYDAYVAEKEGAGEEYMEFDMWKQFQLFDWGKAEGGRIGFKEGEGIMSRVGNMVDVRNVPYYGGKTLQGLVNSAETLSKFPFAAGELGSKLIQQPPKKEMFMKAIEDITPGSWSENLGLTSLVEDMEKTRPDDAKTVGGILGLGTEIAVPTGGAFKAGQLLLNKVSKLMGKVKDGKTLEKLVDQKLTDAGQSRRDFNIMAATSGLMVALKTIGLGSLLKGGAKKDIGIKFKKHFVNDDVDYGTSGLMNFDLVGKTQAGKEFLKKFLNLKKGVSSFDDLEPAMVKKILEAAKKNKLSTSVDDLIEDGVSKVKEGAPDPTYYARPNWSHKILGPGKEMFKRFKKRFNKQTTKENIDEFVQEGNWHYENDKWRNLDNLPGSTKIWSEPKARSTIKDIIDIIEPIVKKAEGGRIGLGTGGPPISGIELLRLSGVDAPLGTTGTQPPTTSLGIGFDTMGPGPRIEETEEGKNITYNSQDLENIKNAITGSRDPDANPWIGIEHARPNENYTVGDDFQGTRFGASYAPETDEWNAGINWNMKFADGGLTKTIPPERGPDPQGLPSALYNGIMRPRSY